MTELLTNLGSKKLVMSVVGLFGVQSIDALAADQKALALGAIVVAFLVSQGFADGMSRKYSAKA
ncbi:MAG: hypothetical protein ACE5HA_03325 [Anaerolineae bacterium]